MDPATWRAKLDLYVGRDRNAPWKNAAGATRSWDLRPGSEWDHLNDSAQELGLLPHTTYYWMVAQEKPGEGMVLLSEVRSLRIGAQQLAGKLELFAKPKFHVMEGEPFHIRIALKNISQKPLKVFFNTSSRFSIMVTRLNLLGRDEVVHRVDKPGSPAEDLVEIAPGKTLEENRTLAAQDDRGKPLAPGEYFITVRSNAPDYQSTVKEGCLINRR